MLFLFFFLFRTIEIVNTSDIIIDNDNIFNQFPEHFEYDIPPNLNNSRLVNQRRIIVEGTLRTEYLNSENKLIQTKSARNLVRETFNLMQVKQLPIVIEPKNLEAQHNCYANSRYPPNAHYAQYHINKRLGIGAQGEVYLLDKNGVFLALKIYTSANSFIMQLNGLLAYGNIFSTLRPFHISQGPRTAPRRRSFHQKNTRMNIVYTHGPYCIAMSYVKGRTLKSTPINLKDRPAWQSHHLKICIKFILSAFRQLQVLHFSFNHYGMFINNDLLGKYSYTMFHGDLHMENILVTNETEYGTNYPHLVDIGFEVFSLLSKDTDVFIHLYNRKLFADSFPEHKRKSHSLIVHRNQMLNQLQILDLCQFWVIMIQQFFTYMENPREVCRQMQKALSLAENRPKIKSSHYKHFHRSILWPLFSRMIFISDNIQTYSQSWLPIYQLLSNF
ncbi:hypothetical protein SNEBB_009551 [Seison nebaliae]|nr:hypothetical protein SNEBB_009551 [Seison nebaliae]